MLFFLSFLNMEIKRLLAEGLILISSACGATHVLEVSSSWNYPLCRNQIEGHKMQKMQYQLLQHKPRRVCAVLLHALISETVC